MAEKFADPDVDESIKRMIRDEFEDRLFYSWDVIEKLKEKGVKSTEARKALRSMTLSHKIVPAGDFTGEMRFVDED